MLLDLVPDGGFGSVVSLSQNDGLFLVLFGPQLFEYDLQGSGR